MSNDNDKEASLLEEIYTLTGCLYLSDLHSCQCQNKTREAILQIKAEAYPAAQWNEAAGYILGEPPRQYKAAQAREILLERLENKG